MYSEMSIPKQKDKINKDELIAHDFFLIILRNDQMGKKRILDFSWKRAS